MNPEPDTTMSTETKPENGQKYILHHTRFGRATVKVTHVDGEWADCEILSGTLRGMGRGAVWSRGDMKTVRIEHGIWTPVK